MTNSEWILLLGTVYSALTALLVAITTMTWWLSKQFSSLRVLIHQKTEETAATILEKLEYHEKHDDQRFSSITNDLWEIRLQNASRQIQEDTNKETLRREG